jgi:arylsulfatase
MTAARTEMHDLARQHPQRVHDLPTRWDAWARRTHVLPRPPR